MTKLEKVTAENYPQHYAQHMQRRDRMAAKSGDSIKSYLPDVYIVDAKWAAPGVDNAFFEPSAREGGRGRILITRSFFERLTPQQYGYIAGHEDGHALWHSTEEVVSVPHLQKEIEADHVQVFYGNGIPQMALMLRAEARRLGISHDKDPHAPRIESLERNFELMRKIPPGGISFDGEANITDVSPQYREMAKKHGVRLEPN